MRLILLAALALAAPAAAQTDPAVAAIQSYTAQTLAIWRSGSSVSARAEKFAPVVAQAYDIPGALALAAGPSWAQASAADKAAAVAALTRHSAVQSATNFARYHGERFAVTPQPQARGADRLVKATVEGSGAPAVLIYRLRPTPAGWRIIDVNARGVSQLAVQRSDFAASLAAGGLPGLTKRLRAIDDAALK